MLNYAKCGAPYWLDLRIEALRDDGGRITHFAAIERDVTMDKRRFLDELELVADRDLAGTLTEYHCMGAVEAEVKAAQDQSGASGEPVEPCVAFIDIDHFKERS